jgi:hypothetical protein
VEATGDLLYLSESDEPFEVIEWKEARGEPSAEGVLRFAGQEATIPRAELSLDDFFKDLIQDKKWHGSEEKADVQRYRNLLQVIKQHLPSAKAFRFGEIEVDIFIIGRTAEGHWVGIKTKAVET